MSKLNSNTKHIPTNLAEHGLNLRAYLDLPSTGISLEDEFRALAEKLLLRYCSREEFVQAACRIVGRQEKQIEDAVKRALSPGELYAEGCQDDL